MNHIIFAEAVTDIKKSSRHSVIPSPHLPQPSPKTRHVVLPIVATICFVLSLIFMVFVHSNIYISGYSIAQLESQQDHLLRDLQALKLEEAVLKRPERIRKIAIHDLGLVPGNQAQVISTP